MVGEIYISNSSDNKINLSYLVEGEYQNSYYLKDELSDQNLFIGQQANPFLTPLSDKLSVHKVFASKVKLSLPAYLKVALIAASSKLSIEGSFKSINIQLLEGEIELNCDQCPGIINTKKADIEVNQVVHSVHAVSHRGKVLGEFSNTPEAALKLNSISGNISIRSQKNNYF